MTWTKERYAAKKARDKEWKAKRRAQGCANGCIDGLAPTTMPCPVCQIPEPTLGMGGTLLFLNDRAPVTVTRVITDRRIYVRRDELLADGETFTIGMGDDHEYTLRSDGYWRERGKDMKSTPLKLGERRYYRCREI